ncbi:hypothetical protein TrCOL_g12342 [Triparma columacea]|uniref:J domain-containing protein n=1 Tax=Triparma columacea TaxID=722753 RepID=A0A9W7GM39_9STRA|nr:hypothetical protein TrCOL_g12342 [Triparma columacea]
MSNRARFTLWCCSAFLDHNDDDGQPDYYDMLSISHKANSAQIKSAYKKKSLAMHPDKLAQQGRELTEEDRAQFIRVKDAYETLINPRTRAVYDSLGEKGYGWYNDPMSIDRKELFHNFCTSSLCDRTKILVLFLFIFLVITLPPIFFCLRADGDVSAIPFAAILTPLWLVDVFIFVMHIKAILMPVVEPPEDDPTWVDPFPRSVRILDFLTFLSFALFIILGVGKLDGWEDLPFGVIFTPYFIYESLKFFTNIKQAFLGVISIEEIEEMYKKNVFEMTAEERAEVDAIYSVIAPSMSAEYRDGLKKKSEARSKVTWSFMRTMVSIFIVLQLEQDIDWSYWAIFTPFWTLACCACCSNCGTALSTGMQLSKLDEEDEETAGAGYGTMGEEGERLEKMTDAEKEELKAILNNESQEGLGNCCSIFFLAGFVALIVGKFGGAEYSSLWILFPFLLFMGILFCCFCYCICGANEEAFKEAEKDNFGAGSAPPFGGFAGAAPAANVPEPTLDELKEKSVENMKVKEMKAELKLRGVATTGMVEKAEIVKGLKEAREGKVGEGGVGGGGGEGVFSMPYVPPDVVATKEEESKPVKEDEVKVVMDDLD